ncbi:MAG: CDP-diacylglycerol--serine O-phosphatidyltransferase [Candidatus Electrothrix sp. AR4]|nr:CDP-diacylglycerol--serine O-phosphatidyltransferase [Candidatus Electrothrix sp. AR4]
MNKLFPPLQDLNIPNAITSFSIVCGLLGILRTLQGQLDAACCLLIITVALDKLDGLIARRLNQCSEMGTQLDSFADTVNFCVFPAVLLWKIHPESIWTVPISIFYVVSGIWRLAFFNLHGMQEDGTFIGVPTPFAASWLVIFFVLSDFFIPSQKGFILLMITFVCSFLMVSSIPYKKDGKLTFMLYFLLPLCFLLLLLN